MAGLSILLVVNAAALILDVFVVDYFSIVKQSDTPVP
jgi:hypothetical protein